MNEELETLTNQTTFAEEKTMFPDTRPPVAAKPDPNAPTSPVKDKRKMYAIVGSVGVLLLVLIVTAVLMSRRTPQVVDNTGIKYTPPTAKTSELQQRVKELQADLDAADPAKVDLPFPPVDLELSLDPPKR